MTHWWLKKPMRMIQTNLREIDANLDVDAYIDSLKDFSAEVVLFNVGGIAANYPTDLQWHYRNPYLQDDLVGKVIDRVQQERIRFLARFDFSKINEIYAKDNPRWLYKSLKGETINYNGQVHTCICGGYQQEYALEILREACQRYPVDGVFFNMVGFVTYDYNHTYHGICQCENCTRKFSEMYGLNLPIDEDAQDPAYLRYEEFKRITSRELFQRIHDLVKSLRPEAAICTYTHEGVDIFRTESNSGIERTQPEWIYSASENVKTVLGSWEDMTVVNAAVHFVDFQFRHAAVSPYLTQRRLAQNLASGGWLDYYVIGHLDNQDDRVCFEAVKDIFAFHRENDTYFAGLRSVADVALVYPSRNTIYGSLAEFRGIFQILSEAHIQFEVIHDSRLETADLEQLTPYQVLILPDMRYMNGKVCQLIDQYVSGGGKLLSTGFTAALDKNGISRDTIALLSTGIQAVKRVIKFQKGMYLRIKPEDKQILTGFENLDIVYLNDDLMDCRSDGSAKNYLGYIPPNMFGPPEKCYYIEDPEALMIPGIFTNRFGDGTAVTFPWRVGYHYQQFSTHAHPSLVLSVMNDILGLKNSLVTDASPLVEVHLHHQENTGIQLVNLVNLSGQSWRATLEPIEMRELTFLVHSPGSISKVTSLRTRQELEYKLQEDGYYRFVLPSLLTFDSIVMQ